MHKRRQNRERQAYGNIADKGEVNVSGNARRPAPRGRPERNRNIGSRGVRHKADQKPKTLSRIRSFLVYRRIALLRLDLSFLLKNPTGVRHRHWPYWLRFMAHRIPFLMIP